LGTERGHVGTRLNRSKGESGKRNQSNFKFGVRLWKRMKPPDQKAVKKNTTISNAVGDQGHVGKKHVQPQEPKKRNTKGGKTLLLLRGDSRELGGGGLWHPVVAKEGLANLKRKKTTGRKEIGKNRRVTSDKNERGRKAHEPRTSPGSTSG